MKLIAQNFLGLERVAWEPRDVSLVVGPNGSGKTSLLQALAFLHLALWRSVPKAVEQVGGARALKRLGARKDDSVVIGIAVGDLRWELELVAEGGSVGEYPGERVYVGDELLSQRAPFSRAWSFGKDRIDDGVDGRLRTCLRTAWDRDVDQRLHPLWMALNDLRIYAEKWSVPRLWDGTMPGGQRTVLDVDGSNLFSVLANWRAAPKRYAGQFEWVCEKARLAFYDIFEDLDIEAQGDTVSASFFPPDGKTGLPMRRAADGLIVGLLHLTAVVGAQQGALVAIDEMESQLHPHAIRVILQAMRERAEERDLTIVLTTHSPVLMDEFAGHVDRFFVTEPGRVPTPTRLDELHDPRYLAQFALGDLYERLKIGAPRPPG